MYSIKFWQGKLYAAYQNFCVKISNPTSLLFFLIKIVHYINE